MDAARLMGIPADPGLHDRHGHQRSLAGLAGALLSAVFFLVPGAGYSPMVKALVVTIFGGLGSIKGTIWAAYIIGAARSVSAGVSWARAGRCPGCSSL